MSMTAPAPKRSAVVKVLHWGDSPPQIVCLIGSTKYQSNFLSASRVQTKLGNVVLMPGVFDGTDTIGLDRDEQAALAELTRRKIQMADTVIVINPNNHVPQHVQEQIEYASSLGRIVRYLDPPRS